MDSLRHAETCLSSSINSTFGACWLMVHRRDDVPLRHGTLLRALDARHDVLLAVHVAQVQQNKVEENGGV